MAIKIDLSIQNIPSDEKLLVDTNIWLYLFNVSSSNDDPGYTNLLPYFLTHNIQLFVNPQIISEYINTSIKLAYKTYLKKNGLSSEQCHYKYCYRKTNDFLDNYTLAISTVKNEILQNAKLDFPNNSKLIAATNHYNQWLDFNDELIINDALRNGFNILTNDRDYLRHSANIKIYQL